MLLLVFVVVIVVFSAIRSTDTAKPTDTELVLESEENLQVISEKDEPIDVEASSEILETMLPVDEEPEVEEEKQLTMKEARDFYNELLKKI